MTKLRMNCLWQETGLVLNLYIIQLMIIGFIFGSEIKAIELSKLIEFEPDIDSYLAYLRHLCVPADSTGNKNIKKLEPGQFIRIDKNGKISKNLLGPVYLFS